MRTPSQSEYNMTLHPPPVVKDGIEEYEVEQILDSRLFRGKLEYLVCWKGYGIEEDKWRPVKDIKGSKWLVYNFIAGTQSHHNIYPPLISPTSHFAPYQTSPTSQKQYLQDGLQVATHWYITPLKGG